MSESSSDWIDSFFDEYDARSENEQNAAENVESFEKQKRASEPKAETFFDELYFNTHQDSGDLPQKTSDDLKSIRTEVSDRVEELFDEMGFVDDFLLEGALPHVDDGSSVSSSEHFADRRRDLSGMIETNTEISDDLRMVTEEGIGHRLGADSVMENPFDKKVTNEEFEAFFDEAFSDCDGSEDHPLREVSIVYADEFEQRALVQKSRKYDEFLSAVGSDIIKMEIADRTFNARVLRELAQSDNHRIRLKVASNAKTPFDVLEMFAQSNEYFVLGAVMKHPKTTMELLLEMKKRFEAGSDLDCIVNLRRMNSFLEEMKTTARQDIETNRPPFSDSRHQHVPEKRSITVSERVAELFDEMGFVDDFRLSVPMKSVSGCAQFGDPVLSMGIIELLADDDHASVVLDVANDSVPDDNCNDDDLMSYLAPQIEALDKFLSRRDDLRVSDTRSPHIRNPEIHRQLQKILRMIDTWEASLSDYVAETFLNDIDDHAFQKQHELFQSSVEDDLRNVDREMTDHQKHLYSLIIPEARKHQLGRNTFKVLSTRENRPVLFDSPADISLDVSSCIEDLLDEGSDEAFFLDV
ncbi:MAG: hypothetical protein P1V18_03615 [Candidatus Gracilibacteria bacterium]|nr:hypothetical protein [Candidatus Gracilibacteria bacterium]